MQNRQEFQVSNKGRLNNTVQVLRTPGDGRNFNAKNRSVDSVPCSKLYRTFSVVHDNDGFFELSLLSFLYAMRYPHSLAPCYPRKPDARKGSALAARELTIPGGTTTNKVDLQNHIEK